jgi:hypothetical protein
MTKKIAAIQFTVELTVDVTEYASRYPEGERDMVSAEDIGDDIMSAINEWLDNDYQQSNSWIWTSGADNPTVVEAWTEEGDDND